MQKLLKEYKKKSHEHKLADDIDSLMPHSPPSGHLALFKRDKELTLDEKKYLLAVERGDIATVKQYLEDVASLEDFNINAKDPLGRSALHIAIEYENIEMIELLLNNHVDVGEAILHAINEEFVEAVEMLLNYQDHGKNYLETMASEDSDAKKNNNIQETGQTSKSFTPDITPLILASHKDNYEIIKILLDRGETISDPHDVRCSCQDCIKARSEDSLRYSKSRINAYKALASPSLISLSSKDPILTAFQLSWELKRLSRIENEFKKDYEKLSEQCQEYASALINETRTSKELAIILNYDHENPPVLYENETEKTNLSRLKLAIRYKQKKFVAHPHCQQLLVSLWYDGISGYRRRNVVVKFFLILTLTLIFPLLSLIYLIMPCSKLGKILRQPFIKFISHSASYFVFLGLLALTSLRINSLDPSLKDEESHKEMRGPPPTIIEWLIISYVTCFIWSEIKQLYNDGLIAYLNDLWNLIDFVTNTLYITTIVLRFFSYLMIENEKSLGKDTYKLKREHWDPWDPTLISEGIFACANIFSCLKLVYIFTINPHLGPLQISLGRMIFDIMKFVALILLVIFAFSCGINQLYWYYAQMRHKQCEEKDLANVFENKEEREDCYLKIKYFSNLFETVQTMYWAVFGLVEKDRLDSLHRKHTFTMFMGLLMFGVYSCIMLVVLINMLIAMMNNSYQAIANQSDEEWKFARSKLWISYFEEGSTLPAPFSLIPSPKSIYYLIKWLYDQVFCLRKTKRKQQRWLSIRKVMKNISEREYKYQAVMKELVKRYVMRKQQRNLNAGVTEDDLNEIKQDISGLRFELLEIFKKNDFKVDVHKQAQVKRKRGKLNLEKAMNKNIFQEAKLEQINKFESFKVSSECKVRFTAPGDSKKSIKSNKSNNSKEGKSTPNSLNNDKNEISPNSSTKSEKQMNRKFATPAMYKIAMSLKKYTEHKFKKVHQESTTSLLNKDDLDSLKNKDGLKVVTEENNTIKTNDDETSKEIRDENISRNAKENLETKENSKLSREFDDNDDDDELDEEISDSTKAPKAIQDQIISENESSFVEKITEV